jgi:hypothetical protein
VDSRCDGPSEAALARDQHENKPLGLLAQAKAHAGAQVSTAISIERIRDELDLPDQFLIAVKSLWKFVREQGKVRYVDPQT